MSKFKVGDLVKVDKSRKSLCCCPSWWDEFDEKKVYKVERAYPEREDYYLEEYPDSVFDVHWLLPAFKFEIGDNALIDGDVSGFISDRKCEDNGLYYAISIHCVGSYNHVTNWLPECRIEKRPAPVTILKVKRGKFAVMEMLTVHFDWYMQVDAFTIDVGIGKCAEEEGYRYHKTFEIEEMKQAYKWLVKKGRKMDNDFDAWMEGDGENE